MLISLSTVEQGAGSLALESDLHSSRLCYRDFLSVFERPKTQIVEDLCSVWYYL